jgi:hypothetical protein
MRKCMTGNQNSRKHHLSRELLVQLYETERLPIAEIQRRTGCGTIYRELVRFGIPRRQTPAPILSPTIKPTSTDIAYAAGFFDGEGCIIIRKSNRVSGNISYSLGIQVAQVCQSPLLWLQSRWGCHICPVNRPRPTWTWSPSSRAAARFLQDVLPFLIVKHDQAIIAIEFQSHKCNNGRRSDPRDRIRDSEYKRRLEALR